MEDVAYLELKQTLKEKYTENFINNINVISKDFGDKVVEVLGNDYLTLKDEYFNVEDYAEKTKKDFLSSNEYLSVKNEVTELKNKIDTAKQEEKDEIDKLLHQKLSSLATLNTTLNNRLKSSREKLEELKKSIFALFDLHKEKLNEIKMDATKLVTEEITESVKKFNVELSVIKENFGITNTDKEYPFDFDKLEFVTVTDKLQSDYFDGNDEVLDEENFVISEDNFGLKN